jgi:methylenetetrahydrofolate dehydrogenase (NADP+)/methenyltetrahydrofolate cyclohydrolase
LVGDDPASVLYVNLKKKAAEKVGATLDVRSMMSDIGRVGIINLITNLNKDKSVHGIMVQLPLPDNYSKEDRDEIINSIAKGKDVDGLRDDSPYLTPTVKAVLEVVREATPSNTLKAWPLKVVVVGAKGFEGKKICKVLKAMDYDVEGIDRKTNDWKLVTRSADILISVTGSPGIIGKDEVKEGAVVIDVGSPKGDVKTEEVKEKVSFISPVPGGIGPVTISCLLENLVESAS